MNEVPLTEAEAQKAIPQPRREIPPLSVSPLPSRGAVEHLAEAHTQSDQRALASLREQNADILATRTKDFPGDPIRTRRVREREPEQLQQPRTSEQRKATQSFSLATADGNAYNLNLPNHATLDDVRAALQAQGASDLAAYLERNVYFPSAVRTDVLQEAAHTFNKRRMHEMHRAESGKNPLCTYTASGSDGERFTITLPKYHTAREFMEALQAQEGSHIGKDGFYQFPGEPTFTEALQDLLKADLVDIPGLLKDIWKALKKGQKEYENYRRYAVNTQ